MASWFEGLAQEWSDSVSRAAASAQRLAGQAELQNLGERVRASVISGASGLGLLPPEHAAAGGEVTEEELARCFVAEACALKDAQGGPTAADIESTLRGWALRLEGQAANGPDSLRALLRSRALSIALLALARSKAGRQAVRAASGSVEDGGSGSAKVEAGAHLRTVMSRASAAPPALLDQLLGLLAEAGKAATKSRKADGAKQATGPEQTLQWVLNLLSAALIDCSEVAVREVATRAEALESAISFAASAAAAGAPPPLAEAAAAALPREGASVWAEWPGDGRWYHARVASVAAGSQEVEVEWSRPPEDVECGRDVEYLVNILGEAALLADPTAQSVRLPAAAVLPERQERPAPAVPVGEEGWTKQLDSAEALSRSFLELKTFCEELATAPKQQPVSGEAAGKALSATADSLAALRTERGPPPVEVAATAESRETGVSPQEEMSRIKARIEELTAERAKLLERLQAIGEEQAANAAALARAERRKRGKGPEEASEAEKHEHLAAAACAASLEIEALLADRSRAAAKAGSALDGRLPDAAASCLKSERTRRRRFEDLLSGIHAALWGPDAPSFAKSPAAVAAARALITRAGGLVEQAWREMVQLAAESLGDGGALQANSEEMSRAAKRYKEMRKELQVNLDRLAKLEAAQGGFAPPPRTTSKASESSSSAPKTAELPDLPETPKHTQLLNAFEQPKVPKAAEPPDPPEEHNPAAEPPAAAEPAKEAEEAAAVPHFTGASTAEESGAAEARVEAEPAKAEPPPPAAAAAAKQEAVAEMGGGEDSDSVAEGVDVEEAAASEAKPPPAATPAADEAMASC